MADDGVAAAVEHAPLAYLTPENQAAQRCLTLLGDRNADLPNLVRNNNHQLPRSNRAAKAKYRFLLSFDHPGVGHDGSWVLGKGDTQHSVDLPICPPRSSHLIGPILGIISIHPRSGVFVIQNRSRLHTIEYLEADIVLGYQDTHVLFMRRNHLRFGPLDYIFEFHAEDEAGFSRDRKEYMQKHSYNGTAADIDNGGSELLCPFLDALPKPTQLLLDEVILHQTVSRGAFGIVRVGVHKRSGEVVACKTIHCRTRDNASVKSETILASQMPASVVGVVPLIKAWCEHGQSPPCFNAELEDVHLLMPYATHDFNNAPWSDISLPTRLALFHQVLEGLRNLHSAGIMHRDISPKNSLILSLGPEPKAAICDFGKSKRGATGMSTSLGPPCFVAPEVWRREGYTNAIDVFSLGLTMLYTFQQDRRETGPMDKEGGYKAVLGRLAGLREQGHIPKELGALLRSMLSWDPVDRPTAAQALDHEAWHGVAAGVAAGPPDPTGQQGSDISSEGGAAAGSGIGSGSGSGSGSGGGMDKRLRRSDGPSPDLPPGGSGFGTAAGSGGGRAKRLRRSDGPSPDSPAGSSGEEE